MNCTFHNAHMSFLILLIVRAELSSPDVTTKRTVVSTMSVRNAETNPALVVSAQPGSGLGETGTYVCVSAGYSDSLSKMGTQLYVRCWSLMSIRSFYGRKACLFLAFVFTAWNLHTR